MPNILKRFMQPDSSDYVLTPVEELTVELDEEPGKASEPSLPEETKDEKRETPSQQPRPEPPKGSIDYARIQAEAILVDARREAEEYQAQARKEFEAELEAERQAAREDGYRQGFQEGIADALEEGQARLDEMAVEQTRAVKEFLEDAARIRDQILDDSREELKELAVAVAEKVIRISLKGSSDILRRMIETAIEKHKRCQWAHVYIADCDARGNANTIPELAAALRNVSARVRVIPMADDESGTCIVETPDEIVDASVSTQLGNIREVLSNATPDEVYLGES